ncbi:MAG TPA: hypothetical protein VNA25_12430 [Phycisphaerae bacterium]|nr:hypothetical protein [Phycisphaerae bacterium]
MVRRTSRVLVLAGLAILLTWWFCPAGLAGDASGEATAGFSDRLAPEGWRVMPIRSEAQFKAGQYGGEAEQHPHGIARSPSHPHIIYIAHDVGQVWKSTDGGRTWRKTLGKGMFVRAGQSIEVDPVDPNTVLAIVDNAWDYLAKDFEGVYRSADGGETWKLVLPTPSTPQRFYQHNLEYDPTGVDARGARRWYAAFPNNGLYRSEDRGASWKQAAAMPEPNNVYAVRAHPADGKTVYVATSLGLFVSRTRGTDLRPLGDLPAGEVTSVALLPRDPARMLAVVKRRGLYASADGGATFSKVKDANAQSVFVHPNRPQTVFLVGGRTGLLSHDGGRTWAEIRVRPDAGLGSFYKKRLSGPHTGLAFNAKDPRDVVAFSLATMWRSADGGRTFDASATGFTGFAARSFAFDAGDPGRFALFCCDVGMVITDTGGRFFQRSQKLWDWYERGRISWMGMSGGDIEPVRGSPVIVAAVGWYFHDKLVRSTAEGRQWTIVSEDVEDVLFLGFHRRDPNVVYAGRKRSLDGGRTWKRIEALRSCDGTIAGMCREQSDTVYAVGKPRNTILRSDDRGETWRVYAKVDWSFNGLDSRPTFAVHPTDANLVYTLGPDRRDLAVFDGKTWKPLGVMKLTGGREQRNFVRQVAIDPRQPRVIYAETQACGMPFVFRSLDGGASWKDISQNLPRCGSGSLAVHPLTSDVLHGSMAGTWLYPPPYESPKSVYSRLPAPPWTR